MANQYTVTFVNKGDETKKTLVGLSKTALRESGKVIRKYLRENIPVRSKRFKNHIASWVMINYKTGQPTLQIGFYSWQRVKKRGKLPSHASPHWVEFGTSPHIITPKNAKTLAYNNTMYGNLVQHPGARSTNVLRNTVQDHIKDIRLAQEKYLVEISKTLDEARLKVDEGDYIEEDD